MDLEEWYYFYEDGMSRAILELNNFVYDINAHAFVKLNDLYNTKNQKLEFVGTSNAATPITEDKVPLLVVDVWEHAYYVDHRNARPAYLEKFYAHINWEFVAKAYEWALKEGMGSVSFYANELHPVK